MKLKRYMPLILIGLVLVLGGSTAYFYKKSMGSSSDTKAILAETARLIEAVGELVVLPIDETPTIATVSDPAALKDQAFFVDAKKGDKVLIYSNAKKAFLYDPVAHKIVNIAPINAGSSLDQKPPAPVSTTPKKP